MELSECPTWKIVCIILAAIALLIGCLMADRLYDEARYYDSDLAIRCKSVNRFYSGSTGKCYVDGEEV